ncbi:hypothetical protein P4O66_014176, partial [Electrophorus voltai]
MHTSVLHSLHGMWTVFNNSADSATVWRRKRHKPLYPISNIRGSQSCCEGTIPLILVKAQNRIRLYKTRELHQPVTASPRHKDQADNHW